MDLQAGRGRGDGRVRRYTRKLQHLDFFDFDIPPTPWPQRLQSSRSSRSYRVHPESKTWSSRLPPSFASSPADDTAPPSSRPVPDIFGRCLYQQATTSGRTLLRGSARQRAFSPAYSSGPSEQTGSGRHVQFDLRPTSAPISQAEYLLSQFDKIANAMADPFPAVPTSMPPPPAPEQDPVSSESTPQPQGSSEAGEQDPAFSDSIPQPQGPGVDNFPLPFPSVPVGQSPPPSWFQGPKAPVADTPEISPTTKKTRKRKRGDLSPIPEEIASQNQAVVVIPPPPPPSKKPKMVSAAESVVDSEISDEPSFVPEPKTSEDEGNDENELELESEPEPEPVPKNTRSSRRRKMSQSDRAFVPGTVEYSDDDLMFPPTPVPAKNKKSDGKSTREKAPKGSSIRKNKSENKKSKADEAPYLPDSDEDDDEDGVEDVVTMRLNGVKMPFFNPGRKITANPELDVSWEDSEIDNKDDGHHTAPTTPVSNTSKKRKAAEVEKGEPAAEAEEQTSSGPKATRRRGRTTAKTMTPEALNGKKPKSKRSKAKTAAAEDDDDVSISVSCPMSSKTELRHVKFLPPKAAESKAKASTYTSSTEEDDDVSISVSCPKSSSKNLRPVKVSSAASVSSTPVKRKTAAPAPATPVGARRSARLRGASSGGIGNR